MSVLQKLKISGKEIEYVSKSKVLGITLDEDLNFCSHAKATLSSCWDTWHKLSDKTTRKRGLNCSTLTILFKTAVLTKLFYAAPVWLSNNQKIFDNFFARVMLKITGSQFYTPNAVSQVLLNLPPLSLQFEMVVVKFHLKSLSQDDDMKCIILQLEETPQHPYYQHVMWTKCYLAWRRSNSNLTRTVSLTEISLSDSHYTKALIASYQSMIWDKRIVNSSMEFFVKENEDEFLIHDQGEMVKTCLLTHQPLFLRGDSRTDNTNMLDFLHGRCLRFKNFKSSVRKDRDERSKLCLDCNKYVDSPIHKLFFCKAFEGEHRDCLIDRIIADHVPVYLLKVLFSTDEDIKKAFKEQVMFICSSSFFGDEYQPSVPS